MFRVKVDWPASADPFWLDLANWWALKYQTLQVTWPRLGQITYLLVTVSATERVPKADPHLISSFPTFCLVTGLLVFFLSVNTRNCLLLSFQCYAARVLSTAPLFESMNFSFCIIFFPTIFSQLGICYRLSYPLSRDAEPEPEPTHFGRNRSRSRSRRSRHILVGAGAGAAGADTFLLEPEPEPEPKKQSLAAPAPKRDTIMEKQRNVNSEITNRRINRLPMFFINILSTSAMNYLKFSSLPKTCIFDLNIKEFLYQVRSRYQGCARLMSRVAADSNYSRPAR